MEEFKKQKSIRFVGPQPAVSAYPQFYRVRVRKSLRTACTRPFWQLLLNNDDNNFAFVPSWKLSLQVHFVTKSV